MKHEHIWLQLLNHKSSWCYQLIVLIYCYDHKGEQ